jgi:hypothetical protein
MTYGDGDWLTIGPLVTLDIAGHEMSHGVMSRTANLSYSANPAASTRPLRHLRQHGRVPRQQHAGYADYMIGEESFVANVSGSATQAAIRYMFNPSKDGESPNCWSSSVAQPGRPLFLRAGKPLLLPAGEGSGAAPTAASTTRRRPAMARRWRESARARRRRSGTAP